MKKIIFATFLLTAAGIIPDDVVTRDTAIVPVRRKLDLKEGR